MLCPAVLSQQSAAHCLSHGQHKFLLLRDLELCCSASVLTVMGLHCHHPPNTEYILHPTVLVLRVKPSYSPALASFITWSLVLVGSSHFYDCFSVPFSSRSLHVTPVARKFPLVLLWRREHFLLMLSCLL